MNDIQVVRECVHIDMHHLPVHSPSLDTLILILVMRAFDLEPMPWLGRYTWHVYSCHESIVQARESGRLMTCHYKGCL